MKATIQSIKEVLSHVKFLKKYVLRHKRIIISFSISWMMEAALSLLIPILIGILIDQMIYYKDVRLFTQIALFIGGIAVFWCLIYFVIYNYCNRILGRYPFDIKMDLINKLLKTNIEEFKQLDQGDFVNTVQVYTNECVKILTNNFIYTIYSGVVILFLCIYIFMQNWIIGLVAVIFSLLSSYVTISSSDKVARISFIQKEQYGHYLGWLNGIFYGFRDLRFLLAQGQVEKKFGSLIGELNQSKNKKDRRALVITNFAECLNLGMQLVVFGLCAFFIVKGSMTLGVFTVISLFFTSLSQNLVWINGYFVDLRDRVSYIARIKKYMELPEEDLVKEPITIVNGGIKLSHVSFFYKEKNLIISDLNLNINPGEKLALVGKSGCGKSTLLSMLVGFVEPQDGCIEIDERRITDCSKVSLRRQVGIVHQKSVMFDGTIRENIRLGYRGASEEQIIAACKQAFCWDWICTLSDGLDTVICAEDANISEGQKQRVAIARIYLRNTKIIILDEATSSLDVLSEQSLVRRWQGPDFQGKTLIVISHRLDTVKACDRIAIMAEGRIAAVGQTGDIIASPLFKDIFS